MSYVLLPINDGGSDGDGRKWPKHHYVRNDDYFLERIATDKWIKDLPGGAQSGVIYRLDRLPQGYAGFERARPDSKHIDRYIYGHPRGQFRSLNEFYPHFKHMMDHGSVTGCPCKHCTGGPARAPTQAPATRVASYDPPPQPAQVQDIPRPNPISPYKPRLGQYSNGISPLKRKFADVEGTSDIYETFITQLKDAGSEQSIDLPIEEHKSPDWWTGYATSVAALRSWQDLPRYAPRCGEVVLFPRGSGDFDPLKWDPSDRTFRPIDRESRAWLEQPEWMAGVVTQGPDEPITDDDIVDDSNKARAVNYSGFRVEPLSDCGDGNKSWTKQAKYVPLHVIRPLSMLSECMSGLAEDQWHPTIKHACKISSSFSIVGRHRFKGTWPHATVFTRGAYIGAELVLPGDVIRLLPRPREQKTDTVTDVMVVSAIRLRLVNLDLDEEDDFLPNIPYQVCLHFSGRVYTQDPTRSYDRVGKRPIDPSSDTLPPGLAGYGTWYHYSDPDKPEAKTELPFTRVLSRCIEDKAMATWFTPPRRIIPTSSFRAVNSAPPDDTTTNPDNNHQPDLSHGLAALTAAREFSSANDPRISAKWFWADTRIEQLDLHEINDRFVGVKHALRTNANVGEWRAALKGLAGRMVGPAAISASAAVNAGAVAGAGAGGGSKVPMVTDSDGFAGSMNSSLEAARIGQLDGSGSSPDPQVEGNKLLLQPFLDAKREASPPESPLGSEQEMDDDAADVWPLQSAPLDPGSTTTSILKPTALPTSASDQMATDVVADDKDDSLPAQPTDVMVIEDDSEEQPQLQQQQHRSGRKDSTPLPASPPVTQIISGGADPITTPITPRTTQVIDLDYSDDDDEDDEEKRSNQLADELAKQFRTGAISR